MNDDIKRAMAIIATQTMGEGSGGPPPPGGWGKGTVIIQPGQRQSSYNDFQLAPLSRESLVRAWQANLMRREEEAKKPKNINITAREKRLGGLFGGDHPHRRD